MNANDQSREAQARAAGGLRQPVHRAGEPEVGLGQAARRVVGHGEAHVVPAVQQDVGVVVGGLGDLGHGVDELHRAPEVLELPLAHDLVALARPLAGRQALGDLLVTQQFHIVSPVRIVSLVPSATELLFALGLGDEVIAVTHECDYPLEALERPRVTRDVLEPGLSARQIDAAVRERTSRGEAIYALDEEHLSELERDLIVTQAVCAVCAVAYDDVVAIAERMDSQPRVISLDPSTVGEVLGTVRTIADATDRRDEGVALVHEAARRIDLVRLAVREALRLRVAALEWLDPVFVAGHWTPQLIEYAGGDDVLGLAGEHSRTADWEEVAAAEPEVVVVMPCGYGAARALEEADQHRDELEALGARQVVAVDAAAYFSRPGPRLVDGLEMLGHLLHPDLVPEPPAAERPLPL